MHNQIHKNIFNCANDSFFSNPAIWLGSRNRNRCYCFKDPKYPFGSSLDNNDFAFHNTISLNSFIGGRPKNKIRINNQGPNVVQDNYLGGQTSPPPKYTWKNVVLDTFLKMYWKAQCLFGLSKDE